MASGDPSLVGGLEAVALGFEVLLPVEGKWEAPPKHHQTTNGREEADGT